jgi:hypothetical protein
LPGRFQPRQHLVGWRTTGAALGGE